MSSVDAREHPELLQRISHVCLGTADRSDLVKFADEALGLRRVRHTARLTTYALEPHTHVLEIRPETQDGIALQVTNEAALQTLQARIAAAGLESAELEAALLKETGARCGLSLNDHSGNPILLLVGAQHSGRRFPTAHARWLTELTAAGLRSTAPDADLALWTEVLGARVRDRVGEVSYLAIDAAHHRIALYPADRNGVLYTAFSVPDVDAMMRNYYLLKDEKADILQGPGKETVSGDFFIRIAGPDGHVFALVTKNDETDWSQHQARTLPMESESLCELGSPLERIPEFVRGMAAPA